MGQRFLSLESLNVAGAQLHYLCIFDAHFLPGPCFVTFSNWINSLFFLSLSLRAQKFETGVEWRIVCLTARKTHKGATAKWSNFPPCSLDANLCNEELWKKERDTCWFKLLLGPELEDDESQREKGGDVWAKGNNISHSHKAKFFRAGKKIFTPYPAIKFLCSFHDATAFHILDFFLRCALHFFFPNVLQNHKQCFY